MLYKAKMSPGELSLLARAQGSALRAIQAGPLEVRLRLDSGILEFYGEEIPTPDREHDTADVDLIRVREGALNTGASIGKMLWEGEDLVWQINVLTVTLSFSPVIRMPEEKMLGVVMPESDGYGYVYHGPSLAKEDLEYIEAVSDARAFVDLDAGVEVITSNGLKLVLYMWGIFPHVAIAPEMPWDNWYSDGLFVRQRIS